MHSHRALRREARLAGEKYMFNKTVLMYNRTLKLVLEVESPGSRSA